MNTYIEEEFEKIIKKYKPNSINELISASHYKVLFSDLGDDIGGCTQSNNRCHTIIVSINWPKWYQEFVMLHEFSHLKLHNGTSTPFYRSIGLDSFVSKMECEANSLALKLLTHLQDQELITNFTSYELIHYLGLPEELVRFL